MSEEPTTADGTHSPRTRLVQLLKDQGAAPEPLGFHRHIKTLLFLK